MLRRPHLNGPPPNRVLVLFSATAALAMGMSMRSSRTPLEALPDLSDVQVIVQTTYSEQAPRIVEDQVTYPIAAEMLKVPGARTVRGYSFFGVSFIYVIFEDGTDLYWARGRVLEYRRDQGELPSRAATLGPERPDSAGCTSTPSKTDGEEDLPKLGGMPDWYLR